jgi:hypothetical protein
MDEAGRLEIAGALVALVAAELLGSKIIKNHQESSRIQ